MLLAGAGFILPAVFFSICLAMIYVSAGSLPAVRGLLSGVQPIILVLILSAAYRLGLKALDNGLMRILTFLALLVVVIGSAPLMSQFGLKIIYIPELFLLLTTGTLYVVWKRLQTSRQQTMIFAPLTGFGVLIVTLAHSIPTPSDIFWCFMVIGGTLFGSGYVIAAYLQRTFVDNLGWLTPQQLLDVLAIGQATPGPFLSTSSAAGYVMSVTPGNLWSGVPGAIAATTGVFLPAFVVILILGRVVPYLHRYPITLDFLKGVNAGVIALLVGTFANLAYSTLIRPSGSIDWIAIILLGIAFVLLERFKWNSLLLVALGAAIGILRTFVGI
jgi:chromate transporter